MTDRIAFIGGGNMAYALAVGLASSDDPPSVIVSDPERSQLARFIGTRIETTSDNSEAATGADAVVFAVKPQILENVARSIAPALGNALVISIAAGVPMSAIGAWVGQRTPIVRCMPNTPALIGAGMTGLIANDRATAAHTALAERILGATGETAWFEDDDDLDAVTAISGSGPAYFFYILEALIEGATELGLRPDVARKLAVQTALGAAKLVDSRGDDPSVLRASVTSPGGTTEKAISTLDANDVHGGFLKAIRAAFERSRELAKEFG